MFPCKNFIFKWNLSGPEETFIWILLFNDHFIVLLTASVYYFMCDSRSVTQKKEYSQCLENLYSLMFSKNENLSKILRNFVTHFKLFVRVDDRTLLFLNVPVARTWRFRSRTGAVPSFSSNFSEDNILS